MSTDEPISEKETKDIKKLVQDAIKHRKVLSLKDSGIFNTGEPVVIKGRLFVVANISTRKLTLKLIR